MSASQRSEAAAVNVERSGGFFVASKAWPLKRNQSPAAEGWRWVMAQRMVFAGVSPLRVQRHWTFQGDGGFGISSHVKQKAVVKSRNGMKRAIGTGSADAVLGVTI